MRMLTDEEREELVQTLREISASHDNPWIEKAANEIECLAKERAEEQKRLEDTAEYARRMRRDCTRYF
jgi:hypothetical protein